MQLDSGYNLAFSPNHNIQYTVSRMSDQAKKQYWIKLLNQLVLSKRCVIRTPIMSKWVSILCPIHVEDGSFQAITYTATDNNSKQTREKTPKHQKHKTNKLATGKKKQKTKLNI